MGGGKLRRETPCPTNDRVTTGVYLKGGFGTSRLGLQVVLRSTVASVKPPLCVPQVVPLPSGGCSHFATPNITTWITATGTVDGHYIDRRPGYVCCATHRMHFARAFFFCCGCIYSINTINMIRVVA